VSAVGALCVHAALIFSGSGIRGGADLQPHLHLMQQMAEAPGLRTVYAPFYHALGALIFPWVGLAATTKLFAFAAAAALIAGFRCFQRAAALPDMAAAVFAWSPYTFALSGCTPKVEVAGYALAFFALGLLLRRRYTALALALAATFLVHTAAALFLGLGAGVLALARGDRRALLALLAGTAAATPLLLAHLAAGCSVAEALMFSPGDYLRDPKAGGTLALWDRVLVFAGPIAVVVAAVGAPVLWRRNRPVAVLSLRDDRASLSERAVVGAFRRRVHPEPPARAHPVGLRHGRVRRSRARGSAAGRTGGRSGLRRVEPRRRRLERARFLLRPFVHAGRGRRHASRTLPLPLARRAARNGEHSAMTGDPIP